LCSSDSAWEVRSGIRGETTFPAVIWKELRL